MWLNESQLKIVLTEGRHRQIRRMCDLIGWRATAIKRVRIGNFRLGGLAVGQWTMLTPLQSRDIYNAERTAAGAGGCSGER